MTDKEKPQHPSGRPVRAGRVVGLSIHRSVSRERLTPGLRPSEQTRTDAAGFVDWSVYDESHEGTTRARRER